MNESGESDSEPDLATLTERAAELKRDPDAPSSMFVSGWEREDEDEPEPQQQDRQPDTPADQEILWAAEKGRLDVVRELLAKDAALVSSTDQDGYTPLHRACYNNHPHVAEVLLSCGASTEARTGEGWTPLHSAARWNSAACLELLLLWGADINSTTDGGLTPLMVAASSGDARDVCFLLLTCPGVRTDLVNNSGDSAADIGRRTASIGPLFELAEPYLVEL